MALPRLSLPRRVSTALEGLDFTTQVFQFCQDVLSFMAAVKKHLEAIEAGGFGETTTEGGSGGVPAAHASTHLPGGSDALATGTTSGTFCVGNDSRLSDDRTASGLRTASTVVSVSAATAPSLGQLVTATSSTAATWQHPAAAPALFARPVTPHAQDDEFDSTTLNAAWQLYDETANAFISFGGAITDQYTVNSTTGMLTDVSTAWPSWLMLQVKNDVQFYWVTKNYALTTNQWICARITGGFRIGQTGTEVEFSLTLAADNAGKPDQNNYLFLRAVPSTSHQWQFFKRVAGVNTIVQNTGLISDGGVPGFEYIVIQKVGTTYHAWLVAYSGAAVYVGSTTHASTMAWVGFRLRQAAGVPSAQMLVHVDAIRFRDAIVAF